MARLQGPPSTQPFAVSFRTYTSEEIKKLSVKEITQSQFFTEIGTPVPGGLYDSALGPSEKNDVCSTCLLSPLHCPGHVGHITLPLPVFNPLYMRLMVQLLHGSCLKCHHLAAPRWAINLFLCRLRLLESGQFNLLDQINEEKIKLLDDDKAPMHGKVVGDTGLTPDDMLRDLLEASVGDLPPKSACTTDRVITSFRNQFIEEFIRDYVSKKGTKCRLCKENFHAVKLENNVRILTKREDGRGRLTTMPISSQEAWAHLRKIYDNDKQIISNLYGMLKDSGESKGADSSPIDQFFIEVLPVIPARFRPIAGAGDSLFSNSESLGLAGIIIICNQLRQLILAMNKPTNGEDSPTSVTNNNTNSTSSQSLPEQLQRAWYDLQTAVNCIVDSDLDKLNKYSQKKGIKQTLERKEGIFRMFMMGKRVNYAARSVISPDPYINSDQIGIPAIIAKKLTYPEPVTDRNVLEMQQAVKNGPNVHPGAVAVEVAPGKVLRLNPTNQTARDAVAHRLMVPNDPSDRKPARKKVHRHIRNGDIVLLNRQPTLHKPGIMAHKVRILSGEKTLRLHYSACKTYNADFDGDEMNVHFPQNEMGRAEAIMIANTSEQYLVPKDGTPLGGLIQDHMIAGVHMTVRGRFFTRTQYQQMVYSALTDKISAVKLLPPAIIKPAPLWSGKQVVSTVILNIIPDDKQPLNFVGKTKVKDKSWVSTAPRSCSAGGAVGENEMSEGEVIIRQGELLCGLLDKENYGPTPYGMVHCCYELYGGQVGVAILSSLGRLFTSFLQQHITGSSLGIKDIIVNPSYLYGGQVGVAILSSLGRLFTSFLQQITGFSLGIKDIIVNPEADKERKKLVKKAPKIGAEATARALDVETEDDKDERMREEFENVHRGSSEKVIADIDLEVKGCTDKLSEEVRSACLPKGLLMKFPQNNLQTMILSGAKGSQVNALQISCLLGQIELEGRRPPLMISGRSLPSFEAYDPSLRAGGYVAGRFLTGIRPQEYFFHCMAGREGLIDTAVKTSRSGYLQRCIIKHLEGLVVNYDLTVRDSDSSVIQFSYGEDGLDISQTPFLKKEHFKFFMENEKAEKYSMDSEACPQHLDPRKAEKIFKQVRKWRRRNEGRQRYRSGFVGFTEGKTGPLVEQLKTSSPSDPLTVTHRKAKHILEDQWRECAEKESYEKPFRRSPDPAQCQLRPNQNFGAISERMNQIIENYIHDEFPSLSSNQRPWNKSSFKQLLYQKYQRSLCEPGEAVGLLAAQSIGEPSTQMTLNTFHFAGRGEMNVTLGIPRLREILMVASKNIKTPSMTVPVLQHHKAEKKARKLCQRLTKVVLANLLEEMNVWESYKIQEHGTHCSVYKVRMTLLPKEDYENNIPLSPSLVLRHIEKKFFTQMTLVLQRKNRDLMGISVLKSRQVAKDLTVDKRTNAGTDENEGAVNLDPQSDDEADIDNQDARKANRAKTADYDDDMQDENTRVEAEETQEPGEEGTTQEGEEEEGQETMDMTGPSLKRGAISDKDKEKRITEVLESFKLIQSYDFDQEEELWCEFTIEIPLMDSGRPDVTSLISDLASSAVVHHAPGIDRCILADDRGVKLIQTEGVNLKQMYHFDKIVDIKKLYTNDVHAMAATFGIEAACRVLIKEIKDVFKVYGITVDPRHLSLIADYMTYDGYYKPFNRGGLETNPSTLQKMTFESCMSVLRKAIVQGTQDNLQSPSARLVLGRVVTGGTGFIDVFPKIV